MAINITWSAINGGAAISEPLDHGQGSNGDTLTAQDVYIKHDGNYSITSCKFWIDAYSGSYSGDFSAALDLAELIEWGDYSTLTAFGGFQINMDAIGSFSSSWPTYSSKGGLTDIASTFRTNYGDTATNGISLHTSMSSEMTIAGTIPANMTNWPHFRARIQIPTEEGVVGVRQFDQKLRFSYTT